jgi:hypothetical protein
MPPPLEHDPAPFVESNVLQTPRHPDLHETDVATVSSPAPDANAGPSVARALSTMKREQTQAVQSYAPAALDWLIRTDSGLRLEPGRDVEELPPVYAED